MVSISRRLREALLRQHAEMYAETHLPWSEFAPRAAKQLGLIKDTDESRFALRVCWLDAALAEPFEWQSLARRYTSAVACYQRTLVEMDSESPEWASAALACRFATATTSSCPSHISALVAVVRHALAISCRRTVSWPAVVSGMEPAQ